MAVAGTEKVYVERIEGELILIRYESIGEITHMPWNFNIVCEASAAAWLAGELEKAAEDQMPDTKTDMPPDHFNIYCRGGMRYDPINVNIHNERDANAPQGKLYTISGMSSEITQELAALLRQL